MKVLLIEDDAAWAHVVELYLGAAGFHVETTDLGEEGVDLAKVYEFDALVVDGHLPDMGGIDVVRSLRLAKVALPILMLTSDSAMEHRLAAFRAGIDDYLAKPCHRDELVARLHALIRRSKGHCTTEISVGPVSIDLDGKVARVSGKPIHLTGKEFQILELMVLRKGSTLTKDAILSNVYGGRDEPEIKIIDVFICKLRKKLQDAMAPGEHMPIETVWGRGYRCVDAPSGVQPKRPRVREDSGSALKVLEALGATPKTFPELLDAVGGHTNTLRSTIFSLKHAGRVANLNEGQGRDALYVARATG